MISGLYTAASGFMARMEALDATTNNLANANTTGYKAARPTFESYLAASQSEPGAMPLLRESQNNVVRVSGIAVDRSDGVHQATGNPLDLALEGNGFFAVQTPAGVRYTRNGSFELDKENRLINRQGFPVMGEGGPIAITGERITIDKTGGISVDGSPLTKLQLVEFKDPKGLVKEGEMLFNAAPGNTTAPARGISVKQGYLETSNVNVFREMIELVEGGRAAESYQKMIQAIDEIVNKAVNEVGRV